MASLPENTEYESSSGLNLKDPNIVSKMTGINLKSTDAVKQYTGDVLGGSSTTQVPGANVLRAIMKTPVVPLSSSMSQATMDPDYDMFLSGAYNIAPGKPVASIEGSRMPIPQDYGGFVGPQPSDQAYILNFQDGSGQMVVDPTQPGVIFKSLRSLLDEPTSTSPERQMMLGSRSSGLFQIDHIIPLWAGGADTVYNMTNLTYAEHDRKTRVQAIPYTLLRKGLITPEEARKWVMDWEDLDYSDIPKPSDQSGMLGEVPLDFAQHKLEVWKKHKAEGYHPNIKKPGLFEVMRDPEFAKNYAEKAIPDWMPLKGTIREGLKGLTSAVTAGWFPYVPDDDTNWAEKGAGIAGNVIGSLLLFKGLGFGATGATTALRTRAAAQAAKGGLFGKFAHAVGRGGTAAARLGEAEAAALNASKIGTITRPFFTETGKRAKMLKDWGLRWSFMRNDPQMRKLVAEMGTGAILAGQLSPQGLVGAMAGEEHAEPIERFITDFIYSGTALFSTPGLKGLPITMLTPIVLGAALEEESTPREWLTNSLIMGGLHMMGSPAAARRAQMIAQQVDDSATVAYHHYLSSLVDEETLPRVKVGEAIEPQGSKLYSEVDWDTVREKARASVAKFAEDNVPPSKAWDPAAKQGMDMYDMQKEFDHIDNAIRQLQKRAETPEARLIMDTEDFEKVMEQARTTNLSPSQVGYSRAAMQLGDLITADDLPPLTSQGMFKPNAPTPTSESGNVIGRMALTGSGVSGDDGLTGQLGRNTVEYLTALKEGKASRTLVAVERPELSPTWRQMEGYYTDKQIAEGIVKPYANPQNTLEVYAAFYGPGGKIEFKPVGYIPRKFSIDEKKYAINKSDKRPEKYDPILNKDTFVENMRQRGFKFLTLNVDESASGTTAVYSGKPYMTVVVNDANWGLAQKLNEKYFAALKEADVEATSMKDLITDAAAATKETRAPYVAKINQMLEGDNLAADDVLYAALSLDPTINSKGLATVSLLRQIRSVLEESASPQQVKDLFEERLKMFISEDEAKNLFLSKNQMTVEDVINFTQELRSTNRMFNAELYDEFVLPFFKSPEYRTWEMAPVFGQIKVMGDQAVQAKYGPLGGVPQPGGVAPRPVVARETQQAPEMPAQVVEQPAALPQALPTQATGKPVSPIAAAVSREAQKTPVTSRFAPMSKTIEEQAAPNSRVGMIGKLIDDAVENARAEMIRIEFSKRTGEKDYANRLKSVANVRISEKEVLPQGGKLTPEEIRAANKEAKERLLGDAYETYRKKISEENAVDFSTNIKGERAGLIPRDKNNMLPAGSDEYESLAMVREAMDKDDFGLMGSRLDKNGKQLSNLESARQDLGDDRFMWAWKMLNTGTDGETRPYSPRGIFSNSKKPYAEYTKEDWNVWRNALEHRGKLSISDFVDRPKMEAAEGSYSKVFADFVDEILSATLGPNWRNDRTVLKVFDTLNAQSLSDGYSYKLWNKLLGSTERGTTQPASYMRTRAEGARTKAEEVRMKRGTEVEEQKIKSMDRQSRGQSPGEEGSKGNIVTGEGTFSPEDFRGMHVETAAQRDDLNIPVETVFERIFSGITFASSRGTPLIPQYALSDAANFMYKFGKAYRQASRFSKNKKTLRINPGLITQVTERIASTLGGLNIPMTNKGRASLVKHGLEASGKIKEYKSKAATLMNDRIITAYKNLGFKVDGKTGAEIVAEIEAHGRKIYGKEKGGRKLTPKEQQFSNFMHTYMGLKGSVYENMRLRKIYGTDYLTLKKGQKPISPPRKFDSLANAVKAQKVNYLD